MYIDIYVYIICSYSGSLKFKSSFQSYQRIHMTFFWLCLIIDYCCTFLEKQGLDKIEESLLLNISKTNVMYHKNDIIQGILLSGVLFNHSCFLNSGSCRLFSLLNIIS